jgi:hypothetical protein
MVARIAAVVEVLNPVLRAISDNDSPPPEHVARASNTAKTLDVGGDCDLSSRCDISVV